MFEMSIKRSSTLGTVSIEIPDRIRQFFKILLIALASVFRLSAVRDLKKLGRQR